ncbi:hypothetical protein [Polyangium jinanense]|uniref:Uncharacterized protein n=1 Tax=Polyangium jinanense TaxID=2829994 RepID=A0A9X3XBD1_9BACT|nr:hypothetical protein [Polyangium jinanense]MDC3959556.1 hypothetical protein [Polyangium jinanense]MDC3986155.1 hypothetical protein [Polyangium jinanense]
MRRVAWLVAFAALLALSAFLMSRGDKPKKPERVLKAEFPRFPKPWEEERNRKRRTLPPAAPRPGEEEGVLRKRDPLLVALPMEKGKSAVVFEVAALKESPIGQIWLDCMLAEQAGNERAGRGRNVFEEKFGLDLLKDVDRIAMSSSKVAVLSVAEGTAKFDKSGWPKRSFGEKGSIWQEPEGSAVFATWGNEIVLAGADLKEIEAAIERLESKNPPRESTIPEWSVYGDIFGVISPEELADMLPEGQGEIAARIRASIDRVDLHVDTSEDVAIVADVNGSNTEDVRDLAKSMGAALSLARAGAEDDGDERLRELLDYATIKPRDGRFTLDVALPLDVLKEMGPCRKRDAAPPSPPPSR